MQTWRAVGPTVEVLGTYDLAAGRPRWLAPSVRAAKGDLPRHAGGIALAPDQAKPRPARRRALQEIA